MAGIEVISLAVVLLKLNTFNSLVISVDVKTVLAQQLSENEMSYGFGMLV